MKKEQLDNEETYLEDLFEFQEYDEILKIRWYLDDIKKDREDDYYVENLVYITNGVSFTEEYLCIVDDELIFFERKGGLGAYNLGEDEFGELDIDRFHISESYHLLGRNEEVHHVLLDYVGSGNQLEDKPLMLEYIKKIL